MGYHGYVLMYATLKDWTDSRCVLAWDGWQIREVAQRCDVRRRIGLGLFLQSEFTGLGRCENIVVWHVDTGATPE